MIRHTSGYSSLQHFMKSNHSSRLALGFLALMGSALTSCASAPVPSIASSPNSLPMAQSKESVPEALADSPTSNTLPRSQPQLIKTATLQITVPTVTEAIEQVKAIAQQQQGDILNLNDRVPTETNRHRTAALQIRVPQAKLEVALTALKDLGEVDSQAVTAEDVSTQIVDFQARLKNLRRTEEMLLEIMGRSGGMTDVLKVSQELSSVRSQVEQITAQLTAMQNQVAYSAISLNLLEAKASVRSQPAVDTQIGNTWESATYSFGKLTVDLLQLGIWLLVYSPYWVVLGVIGVYGYQLKVRRSRRVEEGTEPNV
jgi:Domain of unknown function (DUF4349)